MSFASRYASPVTPVRAVPPPPPRRGQAPSSWHADSPTSPQRPSSRKPGILKKISAPPPLPPVHAEPAAPLPDPVPRPLGVSSLPPPPPRPRRSAPPPPAPIAAQPMLPPPPNQPGTRPDLPASLADLELVEDDEASTLELIARAEQMKPRRVPRRVPDLSADAGADLLERARRAELDGDHDLAFQLYKEAAEAPSHAAAARLAHGRLERAIGRRQRAVSTFKEALHFSTGDRELTACLYVELGQLYWAMGEDEEADYYHRRACALDPSLAPMRRDRPASDIHELNTKDLDLARIG